LAYCKKRLPFKVTGILATAGRNELTPFLLLVGKIVNTEPDAGPALQELVLHLALLVTIEPLVEGFAYVQIRVDVQLDPVLVRKHDG
jgi:hypothetical protein